MNLTTKDKLAFKYIIQRLQGLKYAFIMNIQVYKVDMSFFVVLDTHFIKTHKKDIGALFISIFKKFKNTSAVFTFVSKEKIKDRYIEVTDEFFERYYETKEQKTIQFQNDIKDVSRNTNRAEHIWNFIEKKQQIDGLSCYGKETNDNKLYESQSSYKTKKLAMAA